MQTYIYTHSLAYQLILIFAASPLCRCLALQVLLGLFRLTRCAVVLGILDLCVPTVNAFFQLAKH